MSGWFAVKHGITKHPLFKRRPDRLAIWLWLVDNAVWKDTPHDFQGKMITIKRGQVAVSQRKLEDETGVGRQVIRTFLDRLTTDKMINPDPTHGKTIITICNYEKYQSAESGANPLGNPRLTHDQPIKEQVNNIPVGTADKSAVADPEKIMWDEGVKFLMSAGKPEGSSRSILGKWKQQHGAEAVLVALGRAKREGAIEPVSFIEGTFKFRAKNQLEDREGYTIAGAFGRIKEFN